MASNYFTYIVPANALEQVSFDSVLDYFQLLSNYFLSLVAFGDIWSREDVKETKKNGNQENEVKEDSHAMPDIVFRHSFGLGQTSK